MERILTPFWHEKIMKFGIHTTNANKPHKWKIEGKRFKMDLSQVGPTNKIYVYKKGILSAREFILVYKDI